MLPKKGSGDKGGVYGDREGEGSAVLCALRP